MRIYISATMRSGNSLTSNLLSIHKDIIILMESIHFFRLFYNYYDPIDDKKKIDKIIYHAYLHLKYRKDIILDVEEVKKMMSTKSNSYENIYNCLANSLLKQTNKKIWGENCALYWRYIPTFIDMFEDAKTIHVIRDPRAVFSSWKKLSSVPNNAYINCIFNWIDSSNHILKYSNSLPSNKYHVLKYEDVMKNTEKTLSKLFDYLKIDFDKNILDQSKWLEKLKLNNGLVPIPRSAHEGSNILGFSTKRISNWENHLEDWEIFLIEFLCKKNMEKLGYELKNKKFDPKLVEIVFEKIFSNDLLINNLKNFINNGNGTDKYPLDPRDPNSWGAKHNPSEWFKDTQNGQEYFSEKKRIDQLLETNQEIVLN